MSLTGWKSMAMSGCFRVKSALMRFMRSMSSVRQLMNSRVIFFASAALPESRYPPPPRSEVRKHSLACRADGDNSSYDFPPDEVFRFRMRGEKRIHGIIECSGLFQ